MPYHLATVSHAHWQRRFIRPVMVLLMVAVAGCGSSGSDDPGNNANDDQVSSAKGPYNRIKRSAPRQAAVNMQNSNYLKQIALALLNHDATYRQYPLGDRGQTKYQDGKPLLSWRVHILPFLDQEELYNQFHLDEPWDSEHNMTLLEKMPFPYVDHAQELPPGITNFLAPISERSILGATTELTQNHIADGTSSTVLVLMASADKGVPWTSPADLQIDPADPIGSLGELGDSVVVLFADGSVKPIQLPIEPQQLLNLFNRDDRIPATPADSP